MSKTMELRRSTAAITGAGSGLGRAVAIKLAAKGYRVFGTARSETDAADLEKASAGNAAVRMSWVSTGLMSSSAMPAL
jgi:short-subunit dehydrogenase